MKLFPIMATMFANAVASDHVIDLMDVMNV
jgi:hypothetical protein